MIRAIIFEAIKANLNLVRFLLLSLHWVRTEEVRMAEMSNMIRVFDYVKIKICEI